MRTDANLKTPLFQAHGEEDGVVRYEFGKQTHEALKKMGINAEFHSYEGMAHEANPTEIKLLGEWIKQRVGTGKEDVTKKEANKPATTSDAKTED